MAGNFICEVRLPEIGMVKVFELKNGARCYVVHSLFGQIPMQGKNAQQLLRGAVISTGFGDSLIRKPTILEIANHAPEGGEKKREDIVREITEDVVDSVVNVSTATTEPVLPRVLKRKPVFGFGIFGGQE